MASSFPYLCSVDLWSTGWAPRNWVICNGQLLQISTNQALYALLGTVYGGDGVQTFGVPDLRGRVPVGMGQQPNCQNYVIGQFGGIETTTLNSGQLPVHTHPSVPVEFKQSANTGRGAVYTNNPINNYPGIAPTGTNIYGTPANAQMGQNTINVTLQGSGAGQGFKNVKPFVVLNYIMAIQGEFPSRD